MAEHGWKRQAEVGSSRRDFLGKLGSGTLASSAAAGFLPDAARAAQTDDAKPPAGKVKRRRLGTTDLYVSEIGFGGHSWSYKRVPDAKGGHRKPTVDEATEMIRAGLDMGVNFFDSCTPTDECSVPGEALKRLKRRDEAVINVRVSHKMKGVENDKKEIYKWTDERLKLWQTDYIDLLVLSNVARVTDKSGYWDMTYSIEALDKLKKQGKIRYTCFGSHFTPHWYYVAFDKFGDYFDACSMPYNVRHRVAEEVMPRAKQAGLGVITIKPFARGSLLKKRDLEGADKDLPRDMIAFVLANDSVDVCICGLHTLAQVRENFSASWKGLSPGGRERLEKLAAAGIPGGEHSWLEEGWRYA